MLAFRVELFHLEFLLLVLLLVCLPFYNVQHGLERWSLIGIPDIRKRYIVLSRDAYRQIEVTSRTGRLSTNERSGVPNHIKEVGRWRALSYVWWSRRSADISAHQILTTTTSGSVHRERIGEIIVVFHYCIQAGIRRGGLTPALAPRMRIMAKDVEKSTP